VAEPDLKPKITVSVLIIGYCISIGLFYECAYWSVFRVNIFEYVSSLQILEISFLSAVPWFIGLFFAQLLGIYFNFAYRKEKTHKLFRFGVPGEFVKFLKHHMFDHLIFLIGFIFIGIGIIRQEFSYEWLGIPIVAVSLLNAFFEEKLGEIFSNLGRLQRILLYYSILFLIFAYCSGKHSANIIYEGSRYFYVDAKDLKLKDPAIKGDLKYLGKLDEYLFFCDKMNNDIYVVPKGNAYPLKLMSYPAENVIPTVSQAVVPTIPQTVIVKKQ